MREEITSNYSLAKRWLDQVQKELKIIQRGEDYYLADIIPFFQTGFFNKVMFSLPKKIKNDPVLFNDLGVISQTFEQLNEIIQNIKEYKGPVAITNEMKMIEMFDNILKRNLLKVIELIDEHYDNIIIKDKEIKNELKKIS
ncbi:hypothetical protein JOC34_001338 [Virgibacillus halotolerans]|nr:hypothetical protein [Virgibacillus halotolerans]